MSQLRHSKAGYVTISSILILWLDALFFDAKLLVVLAVTASKRGAKGSGDPEGDFTSRWVVTLGSGSAGSVQGIGAGNSREGLQGARVCAGRSLTWTE